MSQFRDARINCEFLGAAPKYCDNVVVTSRYTWWNFVPKNLYEQFRRMANLYFLVISLIQVSTDLSPTNKFATILPLTGTPAGAGAGVTRARARAAQGVHGPRRAAPRRTAPLRRTAHCVPLGTACRLALHAAWHCMPRHTGVHALSEACASSTHAMNAHSMCTSRASRRTEPRRTTPCTCWTPHRTAPPRPASHCPVTPHPPTACASHAHASVHACSHACVRACTRAYARRAPLFRLPPRLATPRHTPAPVTPRHATPRHATCDSHVKQACCSSSQ